MSYVTEAVLLSEQKKRHETPVLI